MYTLEELQAKTFKEIKAIGYQLNVLPAGDKRSRQNWIDAIAGVQPPLLELLEVSPGVEVESVAEAIEYGRITGYLCRSRPIEVQALEPIAPATETSPGVENCTEADSPPNRGDNGRGRIESESELSKSAMAFRPASYGSAAKNLLDAEADDRNPILTGVTFSDSFLARYSPPQPENIHYQADANGQLSLLDFEVESVDEPPDPDDFECMFAFWAAYDAWCERTDDDSEHCEFSSEHYEPLPVLLTSLDSMCEWAPCPLEWYEPETIETVSGTLEISPVSVESSSTCNFSIPTFDDWCDHPNDKDEPPDTGIFARLPGPKPPKFPPQAIGQSHDSDISSTPKQVYCITYCMAAGNSQPARSPPGGDAM